MRDDIHTPDVGAWLKGREVRPIDSEDTARRVAARLPQVRQRSRWWPFPVLYRKSSIATSTDATTTQLDPIPASSGHAPTVNGRTNPMLSPVKAITAGALVFAIGGVMLVAQPFQQPSSVPGAATDEAPAAPVAVTATSAPGPCPSEGTTESMAIFERTVGATCRPTWIWTDDRLNGSVTWAANGDEYTDGSGLSLGTFALSIENDEGGWRMRPIPHVEFPDGPQVTIETWIMDGEGAYDGLTAVLLVQDYAPHGFIIDGDLPPAPENASPE